MECIFREMSSPVQIPVDRILTGEEFAALADQIGPAELVEGRIKPMGLSNRTHAALSARFCYLIARCLEESTISGSLLTNDVGIYTRRNPDSSRGADIAWISEERLQKADAALPFLDVCPEFLVEIASPGNDWEDLMAKLGEYFDIGARLVWLVSPAQQTIFAYRSMDEVRRYRASTGDTITCEDVLPGFEIEVSRFFESI